MPGEWIGQLPGDLQTNEAFTAHATLGDFAKSHLEVTGKLKEAEGKVTTLTGKIGDLEKNSIPKLAENATPEQREAFHKALGRPDKPEEYEFPEVNGQKNNPEVVAHFQKEFHRLGVPKDTAKELAVTYNNLIQGMVKADLEKRAAERTEAETKLKAELGDKYDASIEMVRRVWKKLSNSEFDAFVNETKIGNDPRLIRFMIEVAKKTGEDQSIPGQPGGPGEKPAIWFDKTPEHQPKPK